MQRNRRTYDDKNIENRQTKRKDRETKRKTKDDRKERDTNRRTNKG